jgi:Insect cuticle protein
MKTIIFAFALIAAVSAGAVSYVKRSDHNDHHAITSGDDHKDYYAYPKYKFEYGVKDPHTGDHKSQWEERDGDVVKGEYTLDEADGTKRVVEYHADGKTGFHAIVKRIGHGHH